MEPELEPPRTELNQETHPNWLVAARAAAAKKAEKIRVLDLREVTSFADYFLVCSGTNPRQIQAIADEVGLELKQTGERANAVEGYQSADWILVDYGDLLVHVFSETAREYYDLERLWRHAKDMEIPAESETTATPRPSA